MSKFWRFQRSNLGSKFDVEFIDPLGVHIGSVEYSTVPKILKICQVTCNVHFDEKIITIRCIVLKICTFEIFENNALFRVIDTI